MDHEVQGVVALGPGGPCPWRPCWSPIPAPGRPVRVQACGVCHTDLHYREGGITDGFPFLLGHEAAGDGRSVGPDVRRRRPGRLRGPQLAGRVRRVPGVPARPAAVLLRHLQRHPAHDPDGRDAPVAGVGHRCFRRQTLVAAGQCTEVTHGPARGGRAAGLRGDGRVSGRPCSPARSARATRWRCSAAAASAARPLPGPGWPGPRPSSPSTSTTASSSWPASSAPPTPSTASAEDPVEAVRAAHRGLRRRRVHRGGRATRGAGAGLLRPGPGRHRGPGRRAHPGHGIDLPMIDFFGRGGAPQAVLVRGLPAQPGLPHADRPLPPGPPRPRPFRHRDHRVGDVEEAFARMGRGEVLRSVVVFP